MDKLVRLELNNIVNVAHETAERKGWWNEPKSDVECLALIGCEVSEAIESLRNGNPLSGKVPSISELEEELVDIIIRMMDFSGSKRIDIWDAVFKKMKFNSLRPPMHGGKLF